MTASASPAGDTNYPIYPSKSIQESRAPSHSKHDSKVSIATKASTRSTRSHQEYLDSLEVPCKEELERISTLQEHKEEEAIMKRLSEDHAGLSEEERIRAAALIQRNYRGHRERRMLAGMSLDPSTRWVEAIKEARYRHMTQPRARESADVSRVSVDGTGEGGDSVRHESLARQNWKKIGLIARRAGGDEDAESTNSSDDEEANEAEREARRKRRLEEKKQRQKAAKMMDLQYFLEASTSQSRLFPDLAEYPSPTRRGRLWSSAEVKVSLRLSFSYRANTNSKIRWLI